MIVQDTTPIYGSEPLTDEMEQVKKILIEASEAVPSSELAKKLGLKSKGSNAQKYVQVLIREMNIKHLQPIISVNKGYLWATSPEQIAHYRKTKIMNRVSVLLVHDKKMAVIQERMEENNDRQNN